MFKCAKCGFEAVEKKGCPECGEVLEERCEGCQDAMSECRCGN